jgi:hypothetical protein
MKVCRAGFPRINTKWEVLKYTNVRLDKAITLYFLHILNTL